jgi:hypothetical protein
MTIVISTFSRIYSINLSIGVQQMSRMTARQRQECIRITTTLINSPGCTVFRYPVNPEQVPDYYKVIKNPRDLEAIRTRLEQDQYATVALWEHDIDLVWSNAERFNGPDHPITRVAKAMSARYRKLKVNLKISSPTEWIAAITHLYERLNHQLQNAPGRLRIHFEGKEFDGPLPVAEVQHFCNAATALTDRSDVVQILQLLTMYGVKLDIKRDETFVSVKSLPPDALRALITYAKDRYRSLKLPYPT